MMGILHGIFPRKIGVLHNICCNNDIFNSLKNVEKKTKEKADGAPRIKLRLNPTLSQGKV